jgi:hypothetical protein
MVTEQSMSESRRYHAEVADTSASRREGPHARIETVRAQRLERRVPQVICAKYATRTIRPARHYGAPDFRIRPIPDYSLELRMRTLLLLSVVATLTTIAACSDEQPATAPRSTPITTVPTTQASDVAPTGQGKPAAGFATVTIVTSNEISLPGGAIAGQAYCPAGTTRISGGYAFTSEGNLFAPPTVSQSYPIVNGWWVRAHNVMPGAYGAAFKVYVLCAS